MELSRLERGEKIAAVAALVLLLSMFLQWYEKNGIAANAWEAFTYIDLILFAVAALTVVWALQQASSGQGPVPASVVTGLAALAALLVLYRIVDAPGSGGVSTRGMGIFLALIACLAILCGGYMGMREEGSGFANDPDRSPESGEDEA